MLGDINGDVVCRTIKSNNEFANTKIIIISGVIRQDEIQGLLNAGAEDFVKKPFNISELTDKIASTLQLS
jgi:DNA-binding response OmpR family regulator